MQLMITFFIYTCKDFSPVVTSNIQYNQRLLLIVIPFVQGVRERFFLAERVQALKRIGNHCPNSFKKQIVS